MSMYDDFVNLYPVQKTLRFELIPPGKTLEHIQKHGLLVEDEERAEAYKEVKKIIDEYHRWFIDDALKDVYLEGVDTYFEIYQRGGDNSEELKIAADNLRKELVGFFTSRPEYKDLFKKELIEKVLPEFKKEDGRSVAFIEQFKKFATYFTGFHENRKNMYSPDDKSTAISFRLINQNLPKFIDNFITLSKALEYPDIADRISELKKELGEIVIEESVSETFSIDNYSSYLSQSGIDRYNQIIGGFSKNEREKTQGINEIINKHNQDYPKDRVGKLKPLYKQILSERTTVSYVPDVFEDDQEVIDSVRTLHDGLKDAICRVEAVLSDLPESNLEKVYIKNDTSLTEISQSIYEGWGVIAEKIREKYDSEHTAKQKKDFEKYSEKRMKELKRIKSYSISDLQELCGDDKIVRWFSDIRKTEVMKKIEEAYAVIDNLMHSSYPQKKKLSQDKISVEGIKKYLDSLKELQRFIKPLLGAGTEADKDAAFYGDLETAWTDLERITPLYNKVRNYITKKPYKREKIKLNFDIPNVLNGWVDSKTETSDNGTQYGGYLFRKKNVIGEYDYYLGVSKNRRLFRFDDSVLAEDSSEFERLDYYQPKEQTIYGSAFKGSREYKIIKDEMSAAILSFVMKNAEKKFAQEINAYFSSNQATPKGAMPKVKEHNRQLHLQLLRDSTFKNLNQELIEALKKTMHSYTRVHGGEKIRKKQYSEFVEIMDDISELCKNKSFSYFTVSRSEFDSAQDADINPLYLFKISNQDLSFAEKYSKGERKTRGTENLHTMFFKALSVIVFKLTASCEIMRYGYAKNDNEDILIVQ